jgi:hypothetical protein
MFHDTRIVQTLTRSRQSNNFVSTVEVGFSRIENIRVPCSGSSWPVGRSAGKHEIPARRTVISLSRMIVIDEIVIQGPSPVVKNGKARNLDKSIWIKLWQRKQHSHPVSRSSASPATSLVLRPTRCVHRILALHMLLRTAQSTRTFLTTVGHPARLLTSQTWRTLPHFRSPITYPGRLLNSYHHHVQYSHACTPPSTYHPADRVTNWVRHPAD